MHKEIFIEDNIKLQTSLQTLLEFKADSFDLYDWREALFPETKLQEHFGYEAHKVLGELLELDVIRPHTVELMDHAYDQVMNNYPHKRKRSLKKMLSELERQSDLIKKWNLRPTTTVFMIDRERVKKALDSISSSYVFTADFSGIIENELLYHDLCRDFALA